MKPNRKAFLFTVLALIAFAGNSVLCRLALQGGQIDPANFTSIRLLSGALFLGLLVRPRAIFSMSAGNWVRGVSPSLCLFVYAACFSFAYVDLETGTGALVLFGTVQLSMLLMAVRKSGAPRRIDLFGMLLAGAGLLWLMLPGAASPSLSGFVLMSLSGIAWAGYTYLGRGVKQPVFNTALNFIYAAPLAVVLMIITIDSAQASVYGIGLACISGALTSGLGYVLWYLALNFLTIIQAAVLQLLVPVIASLGGVLFLAEDLTLQFVGASVLVLGGVALTILKPTR